VDFGKLICHTRTTPSDCDDAGPYQCRFGRWYYDNAPDDLKQQPEFGMIEQDHRRIHVLAQRMLRSAATGAAIAPSDYDQFTTSNRRLVLELDSLRHELQDALTHRDCLTGVYERDAILPELQEWHELAKRGAQQCCVVFMDLDHFKRVNDTHGHLIGDRVLAGSVERIGETLRPYDKLFRYGGDEFVMLLPAVDLQTARRVLERVRRHLASTPLVIAADGTVITITASLGVAELDPAATVQDSLDRADSALLTAKSMGRNRIVAWDPAVQTARGLPALDLKAEDQAC